LKTLLSCTNAYYVSAQDKKTLVEEHSPLERSHLRYLLMHDPEVREIMRKGGSSGETAEIFMHPFLYAFGLFQHDIDQIKEIEHDI
jgi:hypothetical protein